MAGARLLRTVGEQTVLRLHGAEPGHEVVDLGLHCVQLGIVLGRIVLLVTVPSGPASGVDGLTVKEPVAHAHVRLNEVIPLDGRQQTRSAAAAGPGPRARHEVVHVHREEVCGPHTPLLARPPVLHILQHWVLDIPEVFASDTGQ